MPKFNVILLFLVLSRIHVAGQPSTLKKDCEAINQINTAITNGTLSKSAAAKQFKTLIKRVKAECHFVAKTPWTFPLASYDYKAIGGTNGSGYSAVGYHYLDGNEHSAHPAHDIFIHDTDQNSLDDRTQKPVDVLAVTNGVVIACENQWQTGSSLRGGKYIWLYHPQLNIVTYYAHNSTILVTPGDVVKQGQKIAEAGRTGFNAYKKRSPTHLHFSAFKLAGDMPMPYNPYTVLTQAKSE
ncbi:M23 family metallopeptidase [Mucilaginibacter lacusdianchii]|uniref:M23 family metallopeptidase n=1 Tax=Mucilaginibacter lacusdianchii TaxID=2684211 RepID=UPI00131AB45E|nr:M23 family metallopeptidase [Mucilaginibacter sp. JXJ CY 39]